MLLLLLIPILLSAQTRVTTPLGALNGAEFSGIRMFRGVPYAKPPVGPLRFAAPAPIEKWEGARDARNFGPRCMQQPLYSDMVFRSKGMSEDCLYLNIWTPSKSNSERLPVLVYFFGGGFQAGDGSEPRYDGESMARRGIVAITISYRLGLFGFLAHPALAEHNASGNWGLMDQSAALRWVKANIAAFGGDPSRITIAGESAGSSSVSAQMISPLSRDLIAGAIGESGSVLSARARTTRAQAEAVGEKFAGGLGLNTAEQLRSAPTEKLFEAYAGPNAPRFNICTDGYFFPEAPLAMFTRGDQAKVPLLAGWNSQEQGARTVMGREPFTIANYKAAIEKRHAKHAEEVLKAYPVSTDSDVEAAAIALGSDEFTGYSTWKWIDTVAQTSPKPVYRYYYTRSRPQAQGAVHSAEIEYAMGNLALNSAFAWEPEDYQVSATIQTYFVNFIKTGNPNGSGLPKWEPVKAKPNDPVMRIDVETRLDRDIHRSRYELIEKITR